MRRGALLILAILLLAAAYVGSQDGMVRFNKECAEVALFKGGYRSWGFRYSDGQYRDVDTGELRPVTFTEFDASGQPIAMRTGYYRWPKFFNKDLRPFILIRAVGGPITFGTPIVSTNHFGSP